MDILLLLGNIMSEICVDYCKYLEKFGAGKITKDEMKDICKKCPFTKDHTKKAKGGRT